MADDMVVKVEGLAKTFRMGLRMKAVKALNGVTFSVRRGEIFGFLGPNGAGKTTTIKSICNLVKLDHGAILVLGGSFADPAIRRKVGFMPEHAYYHEYLSAREFLAFHGRLCNMGARDLKRRIDSLLELVGLTRSADLALRKYSKGMLQRAGLAQALIADPELLILDEPLSGLDPIGRRDVRDILIGLQKQGKTIFFSTHILPDVEMICDRLAILDRGRTLKEGPIDELVSAKGDTYDLELAGGDATPSNDDKAALAALGLSMHERGNVKHLVIKQADIERSLGLARQLGLQILRLEVRRHSLEEAFMEVLGAEGPVASGAPNAREEGMQ
jgi:ABC-2 type transport system ATP-binding protein